MPGALLYVGAIVAAHGPRCALKSVWKMLGSSSRPGIQTTRAEGVGFTLSNLWTGRHFFARVEQWLAGNAKARSLLQMECAQNAGQRPAV